MYIKIASVRVPIAFYCFGARIGIESMPIDIPISPYPSGTGQDSLPQKMHKIAGERGARERLLLRICYVYIFTNRSEPPGYSALANHEDEVLGSCVSAGGRGRCARQCEHPMYMQRTLRHYNASDFVFLPEKSLAVFLSSSERVSGRSSSSPPESSPADISS